MIVDESGAFSLTKYSNKGGSKTTVKPSDHRTLLLTLNDNWNALAKPPCDRVEVYDYKNRDNFAIFVKNTDTHKALRTCFDNEEEDLESSTKRWLQILKTTIKLSFKKIRIKNNKLQPELEKLFRRKESLLYDIADLEDQENFVKAAAVRDDLNKVQNSIADICAKQNKAKVAELIDNDDMFEGNTQAKIWAMRRKLAPKTSDQCPTAKKDEFGNLVTSKEELEKLYVQTYISRLSPNPVMEDYKEQSNLKSYLLDIETRLARSEVTRDWTLDELEKALRSMKNNKARDIYGHTYELFKFGGYDLKLSLLSLFNRVKRTQTYPTIFHPSTITSIWKKKGDQSNLENDRGIFNVSKIRSILDKLVYNDIYTEVDQKMSCSNIGARKDRNIRDHLFVIHAILNETVNDPTNQPIDIQVYDVKKCFDKLEYVNTATDLYNTGVQNDKFILIANSNKTCDVKIKLPWGQMSESAIMKNIEMQGTVLAPLKCSVSIDQIGKDALINNYKNLYSYKKCVTIPPMSMIDDILTVTKCSLDSIKMNAIIEAKTAGKQLN